MALKETPIVFFGTDDFSLITLRDLIDSGFNVVAVVTKPDSKSGRGHKIEQPDVKRLAISRGIQVWQPDNLLEIKNEIKALDSSVGVVVSYGKIIPTEIIDSFEHGIINVHPSLLPTYRGPSPIESAIKNGDEYSGVSIIKLTARMDAGPIYGQESVKLTEKENRLSLRETLSKRGSDLLIGLLPYIISGNIKPSAQDENKAVYCTLIKKGDGILLPESMTSMTAERTVRAYLGFPKTRINLLGHDIIITKAHVTESATDQLDITFKDGGILSVDELVAPSGRKMTAKEFINGYNLR